MTSAKLAAVKRRNTKGIWFSEDEYAEIVAEAKRLGIYPRQLIMIKVRGTEPNANA